MYEIYIGARMAVTEYTRRKIRFIEGNAKCRHLKNWHVKRLCGRCLSVWGPEPQAPSPNTLYTCIQDTYSHRGKGGLGRVEPERRFEGQQFTKLGRKYQHDWLYLHKLWLNTYHKVPLRVNTFRWQHFALVFSWLISPWLYQTLPFTTKILYSFISASTLLLACISVSHPPISLLYHCYVQLTPLSHIDSNTPSPMFPLSLLPSADPHAEPQSTNSVAMATFWRIFHHDGKSAQQCESGGGVHAPFHSTPSRAKFVMYSPEKSE
jgi:hypothetical protein